MLILLSTSTGNIAHVDTVTETGGMLSIYESITSMLNGGASLSTQKLKATPAEYQALTLYGAAVLGGDWTLQSVTKTGITDPPIDLPEAATPSTDWIAFYDAILITAAFQSIRGQALSSLPLTLALVEFSSSLADAKSGRPNLPAISAAITNVLSAATLTAEDRAELHAAGIAAALPDALQSLVHPPSP